MELVLVTNTSRNAVVELTEAGKYYSKKEYDIYVNGELFTHTDKQVTSLYGFKPDTDYEITAVYDGKEYGPVELHTDYEFVTLNVGISVHMVMVCTMIPMQSSVQLWLLRRIAEYMFQKELTEYQAFS